jgi:hypothetical protein
MAFTSNGILEDDLGEAILDSYGNIIYDGWVIHLSASRGSREYMRSKVQREFGMDRVQVSFEHAKVQTEFCCGGL